MRVAIASDHAGFLQKKPVIEFIQDLGHEVLDLGPDSDDRVDYPDYADKVARKVASGQAEYGVLICGTGLGMAITADKVAGIRAVCVQDTTFARLARAHNNANIVCLSGRFVSLMDNCAIIETFLTTKHAGGRHTDRVAKIMREDDSAFPGVE
ncbi:ribose 5-phosphate isomerase B [uncultured Olegusella sp.]|uniref:ribose 5-phosphate isomerase B n=1 Tax=uncultured Olegusella sp. TaxID=1979846 RepID=UPI00261107D2|nr:ribose 5-phosphate isomerase B [uncultured Olegusella sp.]